MFSKFGQLIKNNKYLMSLYVHWPYCESKCPYCDFNSHVNETVDISQWIKSYKNQLYSIKQDLVERNIDFKNLNAIFFGGGTPSLMPLKIIENIIDICENIYGFKIWIILQLNNFFIDKLKGAVTLPQDMIKSGLYLPNFKVAINLIFKRK